MPSRETWYSSWHSPSLSWIWRTLPLYPKISQKGGKTKWKLTAISFQSLWIWMAEIGEIEILFEINLEPCVVFSRKIDMMRKIWSFFLYQNWYKGRDASFQEISGFQDFRIFFSDALVQKYRQKCISRKFATISGFVDNSDWHLCKGMERIWKNSDIWAFIVIVSLHTTFFFSKTFRSQRRNYATSPPNLYHRSGQQPSLWQP